jgi:hypothetical protein
MENLSPVKINFTSNVLSFKKGILMYGKPVLNTGVPVWFRNHHTFECYILSGYSTMSHQTAPLPHYRQPSLTLHCSITFTHLKDNYSIVKLPYLFKKQRGNLYG